jgi:hypothetical protein
MRPLHRLLTGGALGLFAVLASVQNGSAADPAANAALLDKYVAARTTPRRSRT